ncbi:predicted protein [Chaetomium globosum CBS 148.51]|uniref:Uncharacterized protein n=1 Tax=Chaetomium globosum (strain ATCC 6205 / CBS 148.51 / DSM 1962 / NBRC 6347 / NRRL 1970) TaxID=306901 RepID=Q2H845_CHAGB|nr:uncharacterized protein CHGG_03609 [Chaetomium globosum CBS 148.51]EAQ91674.1 predicted protein [Chaetomium globosum CBS 148.51]
MEVTTPTPPTPHLQARTRIITQTITRPFTTITALVTLGGDSPELTTNNPPPSPTPPPPPPAPTNQQLAPAAPPSALTPSQLGAVLGSVLGLATLILLICCILSLQRRKRRLERQQNDRYYYYDDGDEDEDEEMRERGRWHSRSGRGSWTTVPPPVRFPPTPRYTTYSQTRERQIGGVGRYP